MVGLAKQPQCTTTHKNKKYKVNNILPIFPLIVSFLFQGIQNPEFLWGTSPKKLKSLYFLREVHKFPQGTSLGESLNNL
jgi:hypothetical protein